jgi:hypothetical protein
VFHGDFMSFLQRPVSATILLASCLVLTWNIYSNIRAWRANTARNPG